MVGVLVPKYESSKHGGIMDNDARSREREQDIKVAMYIHIHGN